MAVCFAPAARLAATNARSAANVAGRGRAALAVRAAATGTAAGPRTLLNLNITKATLIDSNGGRAVRNVDGEIYEVVYDAATGSVKVLCKSKQMEYSTEVGKDSRIAIVLESGVAMAGGMPSFAQLQALLKFDGPGPEVVNGRTAMLAIIGVLADEIATGKGFVEQLSSTSGLAHAAALATAVTAASLAPLLLGKVKPEQAFPSVNNSYPNQQLPYFWTALGETINGRAAMVGLVGLLINEVVRGAPLF